MIIYISKTFKAVRKQINGHLSNVALYGTIYIAIAHIPNVSDKCKIYTYHAHTIYMCVPTSVLLYINYKYSLYI